ncbi:MAG: DUF2231 domain-containing protein [Candidatus Nanopelagicales bacterium]
MTLLAAARAATSGPGGPFDLIDGLPVHVLVVHAAVVLIPLAALGLIAMALSVRLSRHLGWLVVLGAVVATGAAVVAKESGEKFQIRVGAPGFDHNRLGDVLPIFAGVLLLATLLLWWIDRAASSAGARGRRGLRMTVAVLAVIVAAANLVWVYRVGDSGARSVWSDTVASATSAPASSPSAPEDPTRRGVRFL